MNAKCAGQSRKQKTIQKPISYSGLGVHTGEQVTLRFCPAPEKSGVVFKRIDLPHQPVIPARIEYVCDTARSTSIGIGSVCIHTVEHVLAAVHALEIDNLVIEVSNLEPPIADGGSKMFVKLIEDAGIMEQNAEVSIFAIDKPYYWSNNEMHIVALPYNGYRLSYTLNYPASSVLQAQFHSIDLTPHNFKEEIAPCRTFSLYEELAYLMKHGLIKGGSLDNAVVIKGNAVFSKEGLHFPNEMARHKILDMIGDFSLIGIPFHAHLIAIRSGHMANFQLAKIIYNNITSEDSK